MNEDDLNFMTEAATVFRHAPWEEFELPTFYEIVKRKIVSEFILPEGDYKGWQKEVRVGAN